MGKATIVAASQALRAGTLAVLRPLHARGWEALCPTGVRVRQVAARLVAVDEAAAGPRLPLVLRAVAELDPAAPYGATDHWQERSPDELLEALERVGRRFERRVGALPAPAWRVRWGGLAVAELVEARALAEWVAAHDVATATVPGPEPTPPVLVPPPEAADAIATAVLRTLPRAVLPAVPRTTGVLRLVVDVAHAEAVAASGSLPVGRRHTWGVDFARRQFGPRVVAPPEAVIRTTAPVLALLSTGRVAWRSLPSDRFSVEGDVELAAALLDQWSGGSGGRRA